MDGQLQCTACASFLMQHTSYMLVELVRHKQSSFDTVAECRCCAIKREQIISHGGLRISSHVTHSSAYHARLLNPMDEYWNMIWRKGIAHITRWILKYKYEGNITQAGARLLDLMHHCWESPCLGNPWCSGVTVFLAVVTFTCKETIWQREIMPLQL